MGQFSNRIAALNKRYEGRMRAVAARSVQAVVARAQVTTGQGGRMRIDTGFLRASIQANVGGMPSGETQPRKGAQKGEYPVGEQVAGEPVSVTLLRWDPSHEVLFVGWTANYARHREAQDGFLRGAVEPWDEIVRKVTTRVKRSGL